MDELMADLREAFEEAGYDVSETSVNRDRVRVAVTDAAASGGELRDLTEDVVDSGSVLGLDVTTESAQNQEPTTVVSFRYRG
jgi:8-oxo-dGTP pyrophosphatase MutT (NUDIX family)